MMQHAPPRRRRGVAASSLKKNICVFAPSLGLMNWRRRALR